MYVIGILWLELYIVEKLVEKELIMQASIKSFNNFNLCWLVVLSHILAYNREPHIF